MNKLMLALAGVAAASCGGRATDDTLDTGEPPPECVADRDCGTYRICEANACLLGDRDDTFDGARTIFQVTGQDDPNVGRGMIHAPGDIDHWAYQSTGREWLRIWTQTDPDTPDGLNTVVSVFGPNGALHHVMDDAPTGTIRGYDSFMHVYLPVEGRWIVRVEDRSTHRDEPPFRGGPTFLYALGVEAWASVATEPDSPEQASRRFEMANGTTVYAYGFVIEEPGDIDYARLTMPWSDAPLEIWGAEDIPGSRLRSRVEVVAGDDTGELVLRKDDVGATGNASLLQAWRGTYLVSAMDQRPGAGGHDHWGTLYFRTRAEGHGNPREVEPNDDAETATPVALETVTEGGRVIDRGFFQASFLDGDTSDWFVFEARADGRLRTVCSSTRLGALGDVDVDVIDAEGSIRTVRDGDDKAPDIPDLPVTAGKIHLRFYEAEGLTGRGVYYRCGVYLYRD
jgi:hypothetical protein